MRITVKIVKWVKKVGGTVKRPKSQLLSISKDYIDNINDHAIFVRYFILPWTLTYEKKRNRNRKVCH